MPKVILQPNDAILGLIRATASDNLHERDAAQMQLAKAITTPLREVILYQDVTSPVFTPMPWPNNTAVEFPLDLIAPGQENEFIAYTSPGSGYIAQKKVHGDYVTIPTYGVANAIDWELKFARQANWAIVARAMEVMEAGFVKKKNDDCWNTVLSAVVDRNLLVYDGDATAGMFTKRLVSLGKTTMTRNGGGNSVFGGGKLTDIFMSPEGIEDIRNWGVDQVDELTRREIYLASDDGAAITRVFGVNLHPMLEFGVGQQYQQFFVNQLGGAIEGSDTELAIGLDLSRDDSFLMPVTLELQVFADPTMHRRQEEGYYGWFEMGCAVMDNRRVIALSY